MVQTKQNGKRWQLMHAVLALGDASPNHERLAEAADIGVRTVSSILNQIGPKASRLLQSGHPVRFGPGAGLALGLSVGSQSIRGALVDANGELHHEHSAKPVSKQLDMAPGELARRLRSVAAAVLRAAIDDKSLLAAGDTGLALLGTAVAWPSPLDREKRPRGSVLSDPNWRAIDRVTGEARSIPMWISEAFGRPFVANHCHAIHDVNAHGLCLAFHESRARTIDPNDIGSMWRVGLVLRVGEVLGACSMLLAPPIPNRLSFIDSKLIEGTKGLAGELGHLRVDKRTIDEINETRPPGLARIDYERSRCSCGRKYHLEAFASASALVRRLEASDIEIPGDGPTQEHLLAQARQGLYENERALAAGRDIGRILGHALAGPVLLLNPSSITVTGPLASEDLVRGIERAGDAWASVVDDSVKVDIDRTAVGDYIGVKGAGLALIRKFVYRDFLDERGGGLTPDTFLVAPEDVERLEAI